ncbi:hypothetical protein GF326_02880 [Candidatus Bathyarchaeota archaeon]|nr:hypothetical protein [Candidatus Bathyarchaeota archaeon]
MNCQTSELTLEIPETRSINPAKIRGYIASKHIENSIFHQHTGNELHYRYPLIHYHIINTTPVITGWQEGVQETEKLFKQLSHLQIDNKKIYIHRKKFVTKKQKFGISNKKNKYMFISPWLALNNNNYQRFLSTSTKLKKGFLEKILTGNILSASKGLDYTVEARIKPSIIYTQQIKTKLKGTPLVAFKGAFEVNFDLPELFGVGKSVSRGFGAVKRI